ncbi:hypothetical protein ACW7G2_11595 [Luteimonas sp. A277]
MTNHRSLKLSTLGLGLGALALLVAIVHFWIVAAAPSPPLEDMIADKVVAIRDATVNRFTGRAEEPQGDGSWDREQLVIAATSLLGGLAIVLAIFGFVRREPRRPCIGAAVLGVGAVAFPFVIGALGAVIVLLALGAIVSVFLG